MKFTITLFAFLAFSILSEKILAQCECPQLPDPQGVIDTVSTVGELQAALQQANQDSGNHTILLEDGTYELFNNLLYIGQNMSNLTIRSLSGDRDAVIVKGPGMDGNISHVFNVAAKNFTAADLTIGWVANHAIQIHAESDADFPLIQNVKFVDVREQMLKVSGSVSSDFSDGGVVQCCEFEFTDGVGFQYYTGGIDAHRAKDWVVRNNIFRHIRSPENMLSEHAIHFWSWSENTLVENNLIINCDRGIGFGLGSSGHNGGTIRNNWVHTSRDVGIGLESAPDVKIYHNTVFTENYFNSIEYRFTETVNTHIANNLTNKSVASRDGGTGTIESNFLFADASIFVDAEIFDYHLTDAHLAIANEGVLLAEAALDYDCHERLDGLPDIGADEFDSVFNPTNNISRNESVRVFPNPSSGEFFIKNKTPIFIEIYDLSGKKIIEKELPQGGQTLFLNDLSSGVYFLKWVGYKMAGVEKVVIK